MTTEIGIFLPRSGNPAATDAAPYAEKLGLDGVWKGDHLDHGVHSTLELAAAAAVTERIGIGLAVLLPALRPLAWAARELGTLSRLAGPRLVAGIGVGGATDEWRMAGVPTSGRGRATDELLRALPGLLGGKPTDLTGIGEVALTPSAPLPSIWVGGGSEAALRRTARYGDGWIGALRSPAQVRETRARLAELAAEEGRPAPKIAMVIHGSLVAKPDPGLRDRYADGLAKSYGIDADILREAVVTGTPAEVSERLAEYADSGVEKLAFVGAPGADGWYRTADLLAQVRRSVLS
ncbi:LLM class flavin-dependent oxidoreductase [Amycolatopsis sp. CA-230715]|uniref:LLM class flavin-dependent oxidoreductase n=1 Tax=Amycolatopsis sp. CA-230715 TaxID=2745196 RepID=UPI001C00D141|nr:LLM class flavin-dependent oxidoreductase [Amycolatopsis sp. CA-230715]QWF80034.1 Alkanesulfonate monooxygenase [Amycolatopsis sp. CA-230715]